MHWKLVKNIFIHKLKNPWIKDCLKITSKHFEGKPVFQFDDNFALNPKSGDARVDCPSCRLQTWNFTTCWAQTQSVKSLSHLHILFHNSYFPSYSGNAFFAQKHITYHCFRLCIKFLDCFTIVSLWKLWLWKTHTMKWIF